MPVNLSGYEGISNQPSATPEGTAKGEAGLGHWRLALNGYTVDSSKVAVEICRDVLDLLDIDPGVTVSFKPGRNRTRGNYGQGHINLFGITRLATLLHELAHHVTRQQFGRVASHGREFKREFVRVFEAFGAIARINLFAEAGNCKIQMEERDASFKPGDIVSGGGREFKITGRRRTRVTMECTRTGKGPYTAKSEQLTLVRRPSAPKAEPIAKPAPKAPTTGRKFQVGDIAVRPSGSKWEVTGYDAKGRVEVTGLADGFVGTWSERSIKKA